MEITLIILLVLTVFAWIGVYIFFKFILGIIQAVFEDTETDYVNPTKKKTIRNKE